MIFEKKAVFLAATLLLIISFSMVASSEIAGNISLESANNSVVSGLWAMTVSTTTTINSSATGGSTGSSDISTTTTLRNTTPNTTTTTTLKVIYEHIATESTIKINETALSERVENDKALKSKLVSMYGSIDRAVDMKKSSDIAKNISIIKTIDVINNGSKIEFRIFYNGSETLSNFMIYSYVPKSFAIEARDITVITSANYTIVESDPTFLFTIPSIKQFTAISIKYAVNRSVDKSVLNSTDIMILSGYENKQEFPIWIIELLLLLAVAGLAYLFQDKLLALFGKPKKYEFSTSKEKRKKIIEFLKSLLDRLTSKKREVKVIYK